MVKCPRCGYDNIDSSNYCVKCTYPLKNSYSNLKNKSENKSSWSNIGTGKKIAIVLGICIIALLLFSIIQSATTPDKKSSLNVVTSNNSLDTSSTPFQVKVIYSGSWYGQMGSEDTPGDYSHNGNETIRLDSPAWDHVFVNIHKNDYSSNELKIQILKNGKVVGENSTTTPNGEVILRV